MFTEVQLEAMDTAHTDAVSEILESWQYEQLDGSEHYNSALWDVNNEYGFVELGKLPVSTVELMAIGLQLCGRYLRLPESSGLTMSLLANDLLKEIRSQTNHQMVADAIHNNFSKYDAETIDPPQYSGFGPDTGMNF